MWRFPEGRHHSLAQLGPVERGFGTDVTTTTAHKRHLEKAVDTVSPRRNNWSLKSHAKCLCVQSENWRLTSFSVKMIGSNTSSPAQLSTCSLAMADRSWKPSASMAASRGASTFLNILFIVLTLRRSSSGSVISSRCSSRGAKQDVKSIAPLCQLQPLTVRVLDDLPEALPLLSPQLRSLLPQHVFLLLLFLFQV